jgi:hypothetical protein
MRTSFVREPSSPGLEDDQGALPALPVYGFVVRVEGAAGAGSDVAVTSSCRRPARVDDLVVEGRLDVLAVPVAIGLDTFSDGGDSTRIRRPVLEVGTCIPLASDRTLTVGNFVSV